MTLSPATHSRSGDTIVPSHLSSHFPTIEIFSCCCRGATFPTSSSFIGNDSLGSGLYKDQALLFSLEKFRLKDWNVDTLVELGTKGKSSYYCC